MSATIQQPIPKLAGLISLVLVTVLGISVAKLMWLAITPKQPATSQIQTTNNVASTPKEKINYGKLISNHHLFGVVEVKKAPVVQAPIKTEAPKVVATKLNLKLHGIVSYKAANGGFALISSNGGAQKVYGKGEELQNGVTVSEIFSDKVVLDNHGTSEELLLPVKESLSARTSPSLSSPPPNLPGMNKRDNPTSQPSTGVDLSSIRQEAVSNPQKLMEIARPSPAVINGKFTGFRVQPGRKRKLFRQLGFRPNDIITEVNGIILDDFSKGLMLQSELTQASNISITVKRGSQEIILPTLNF